MFFIFTSLFMYNISGLFVPLYTNRAYIMVTSDNDGGMLSEAVYLHGFYAPKSTLLKNS